MRHQTFRSICLVQIIFTILAAAAALFQPAPPPAQAAAPSSGVAALLILDDSGSMQVNDPGDLRYTAARLFVAGLDSSDLAGAVAFSTTSRALTPGLLPLSRPADKQALIEKLQPVRPNGYTDVKAAFEAAARLAQTTGLDGRRLVVVFLTDGKPQLEQPEPGYEDAALDSAARLGVPVYAVALTPESQSTFLNRLAERTGGRVIAASSSAELVDSYLSILGEIKDRTVTGRGTTHAPAAVALMLEPSLMPYVEKVTLMASLNPPAQAAFLRPDGTPVLETDPDVLFWSADPRYLVITLQHPAGGEWRARLSGSGAVQARAVLHSRLRARLPSPGGLVQAGQPVTLVANLVEAQPDGEEVKIIGQAAFSALVTLPDGSRQSLDAFYDDGTHGDQTAGDGNYSRLLVDTAQPGRYQVELRGAKGAVPVALSAGFEAAAVPAPLLVEPARQRYEVRGGPLPLQLRLEGLDDPAAFEGGYSAEITAPDGTRSQAALQQTENRFGGEFVPLLEGVYRITYRPAAAYYRGLPLAAGLTAEVEVVQIAAVQVLGVAPSGSIFEMRQAAEGIPVVVSLRSTSAHPQVIFVHLEGMPGFTLVESGEIAIPPRAETSVTLHLRTPEPARPGQWTGALVATAEGPLDVLDARQPLAFRLVQPEIQLAAAAAAQPAGACYRPNQVSLTLEIQSGSLQAETLQVTLLGIPGAELSAGSITVPPGSSRLTLTLDTQTALPAGRYTGEIAVSGARSGLLLRPEQALPVQFEVQPLMVSCRKPLILLGSVFGGLVMIIAIVAGSIGKKNRPPHLAGTLTIWHRQAPNHPAQVDLTAMKKTEVTLGKGKNCDILINDPLLEDIHAVISAERGEGDEVRLLLQPRGKIQRGYRAVSAPALLEEKQVYTIGDHSFQFFTDPDL